MFVEGHVLILGVSFPSFGGNFSTENMKLREYLTLFFKSLKKIKIISSSPTKQVHQVLLTVR